MCLIKPKHHIPTYLTPSLCDPWGTKYQACANVAAVFVRTRSNTATFIHTHTHNPTKFLNAINRTIDNVIGRAAHIRFLESDALFKMFINCPQEFFR